MQLKTNSIALRPYGTNIQLKVLGKVKMLLENRAGRKIKSTVFVMDKLKGNLDTFVEKGVIDCPLEPEIGTGGLCSIVVATKKWDQSNIRVTLDIKDLKKILEK